MNTPKQTGSSTGASIKTSAARVAAETARLVKGQPKPKKRRSAAKRSPLTGISNQQRHEMIAEAAYFCAAERGFAAGFELEDWLAAEEEIDARIK